MNIEDEIRRIVNEELDRRLQEENRKAYRAELVPKGTDARAILDGDWDSNEVAMPEPEVPWQQRHDRKTYVSKTPYGDAEVTTVPENRCRWCNEPIALEVNTKGPDDFWYHLRSGLWFCEGYKQIAEPKEESNATEN